MLNLPIRVSFITSVADIAQTIASQWSRRARNASRTGLKCSSMNSIVATTMSPRAMSSLQRASASGSSPQTQAAWTESVSPVVRASPCGFPAGL